MDTTHVARTVFALAALSCVSSWTMAEEATAATPAAEAATAPASDTAKDTVAAESAADPCNAVEDAPAWIDRLNYRLYRLTCSSASWFDGLFGNRRYDQEYRESHGQVLAGAKWSERDGVSQVLRFRARITLPQTSNKLNAFIGRDDPDEFIAQSKPETYAVPTQFSDRNDQVFVGIGYREETSGRGSFDTDLGVRLKFPLDPYIKGSYRYVFPAGERNLVRLRETAFWQESERLGVTSSVEWDRLTGEHSLVRWTNSGTFSEKTVGVRWYSELTLYYSLDSGHALAYQGFATGQSDLEIPITNYGANLIYRQRIWRDWLLIEARTGVDWPRYGLSEPRDLNWNAGLAFELRYGEH